MPIVNKGIFDLDIAFQRQVGNDWPIAEVVLGTGGLGANLSANTTDDLTEGTTNLYYTNARVLAHLAESNVSAKSFTTTGVGTPSLTSETSLILSANGTNGGAVVIQSSPIRIKSYTTVDRGNITAANGDLIFNNTDQVLQVYSSNSWLSVGSIDLSGNTTTDLAEGDNLYYTNTRVSSYLLVSDIEVQNLQVSGNLTVLGNSTTINATTLEIDDPIVHLASNNETSDSVDFGWLGHYSGDAGVTKQHAGMFRKHGTDNFYIFSQYVDENLDSGNLVTNINLEDNTFVLADVYGNVFYGKISTLSNFSTADLTEGNNLYYTNARVQSYLDISGYQTAANILANVVLGIDLSGNTTTDLAEGDNLYYTNARVGSYVNTLGFISGVDLSGNTTTDLAEGDNLYYTNIRVQSYLDVGGYQTAANILANVVLGIDLSSNTTTDLAEGDNLYYTNSRVQTYLDEIGYQTAANIFANVTSTTDLSGNTTTDLAEGDNLYYTNDRVRSAFTAGDNISIDANGIISAGTSIFSLVSSVTTIAQSATLTYDIGVTLGNAQSIIVTVEGLIQIPGTDYSVDGANVVFTEQPPIGANIEVKLFGTNALSAGDNITIEANGRISSAASGTGLSPFLFSGL